MVPKPRYPNSLYFRIAGHQPIRLKTLFGVHAQGSLISLFEQSDNPRRHLSKLAGNTSRMSYRALATHAKSYRTFRNRIVRSIRTQMGHKSLNHQNNTQGKTTPNSDRKAIQLNRINLAIKSPGSQPKMSVSLPKMRCRTIRIAGAANDRAIGCGTHRGAMLVGSAAARPAVVAACAPRTSNSAGGGVWLAERLVKMS